MTGFLAERKLFGVKFVFDGMDYPEVIKQELRQVRTIMLNYSK